MNNMVRELTQDEIAVVAGGNLIDDVLYYLVKLGRDWVVVTAIEEGVTAAAETIGEYIREETATPMPQGGDIYQQTLDALVSGGGSVTGGDGTSYSVGVTFSGSSSDDRIAEVTVEEIS